MDIMLTWRMTFYLTQPGAGLSQGRDCKDLWLMTQVVDTKGEKHDKTWSVPRVWCMSSGRYSASYADFMVKRVLQITGFRELPTSWHSTHSRHHGKSQATASEVLKPLELEMVEGFKDPSKYWYNEAVLGKQNSCPPLIIRVDKMISIPEAS